MEFRLEEYITGDGSIPFRDWFLALDPQAAARVTVALHRLGAGNLSNIKWFRGIGECKVNWGPGYRIYFLSQGESLILLLGGSTKKDQQKVIERVLLLVKAYKKSKQSWDD